MSSIKKLRDAAMDQSNPYRAFHMASYVVLMESFRDAMECSLAMSRIRGGR